MRLRHDLLQWEIGAAMWMKKLAWPSPLTLAVTRESQPGLTSSKEAASWFSGSGSYINVPSVLWALRGEEEISLHRSSSITSPVIVLDTEQCTSFKLITTQGTGFIKTCLRDKKADVEATEHGQDHTAPIKEAEWGFDPKTVITNHGLFLCI